MMSTLGTPQLSSPRPDADQLASARARRSIRDILPVELWLLVKNFYEPWDLVAHASLYKVSAPITEALYGNAARRAAFWEEMCLKNGLGLLPDEEPDQVDWEKIVLQCAEDARSCDHPECGLERLAMNVSQMEAGGMSAFTCWEDILSQNILMESTIGHYPNKEYYNKASPLLSWVSFHEKSPGSRESTIWRRQSKEGPEDLDIDAHLRFPKDQDQAGFYNLALLRKYAWNKHPIDPIARRSFAVFPRVIGMWCWPLFLHGIEFQGEFGITMDHWVHAIETFLDDPYGTHDTICVVDQLRTDFYWEQVVPRNTFDYLFELMRRCTTIRGFLTMFHIECTGIQDPGSRDWPCVACSFEPAFKKPLSLS